MGARSQRHLIEVQGIDSDGQTANSTLKPKVVTVPTKSGTAQQGQTLTGVNGTFAGPGTTVITRAWLRDGVAIGGATAATYLVAAADVGHVIKFRNIGTNFYGATNSDSTATATVIGP